MPKVKRSRKPPPEGWELIEPTLDELDQKMREGESQAAASCRIDMHKDIQEECNKEPLRAHTLLHLPTND